MDDHVAPESLIATTTTKKFHKKRLRSQTQSNFKKNYKKQRKTLYPSEIYYSYVCPYCNSIYRSVARYFLSANFKNSHLKKCHHGKEFNAEHFNNNIQEPEYLRLFAVNCLEKSCEYFIQSRYGQIKRKLIAHLHAHENKQHTREEIINHIRINAIQELVPNPKFTCKSPSKICLSPSQPQSSYTISTAIAQQSNDTLPNSICSTLLTTSSKNPIEQTSAQDLFDYIDRLDLGMEIIPSCRPLLLLD